MPRTVIANQGQGLIDIALQTSGSAEAAFELAVANGRSITGSATPGDVLLTVDVVDGEVASYYRAHGIRPASADVTGGGIGYWVIEESFIVS